MMIHLLSIDNSAVIFFIEIYSLHGNNNDWNATTRDTISNFVSKTKFILISQRINFKF